MSSEEFKKRLLEVVGESMKESWTEVFLALPPTTAGKPALEDSELIKNVTFRVDEGSGSVSLYLPFYEKYIESGREGYAKKGFKKPFKKGEYQELLKRFKPPPIDVIIKWMKRKGIATGQENSVAFAISRGISKNGIIARPFTDTAVEKSTEDAGIIIELAVSDWLDEVILKLVS